MGSEIKCHATVSRTICRMRTRISKITNQTKCILSIKRNNGNSRNGACGISNYWVILDWIHEKVDDNAEIRAGLALPLRKDKEAPMTSGLLYWFMIYQHSRKLLTKKKCKFCQKRLKSCHRSFIITNQEWKSIIICMSFAMRRGPVMVKSKLPNSQTTVRSVYLHHGERQL